MSTMQGATTIPTGNGMIEWREEKIRQGLKCDGKTSKKNIDGGIDIMKRFPQKKAFSSIFLTLAKFCNTFLPVFFSGFESRRSENAWKTGVLSKVWKKSIFLNPFLKVFYRNGEEKICGRVRRTHLHFLVVLWLYYFFSDNIQGWRVTLLMIILKCGAPCPVVSSLMRISQKLLKCSQHLLQDGNWTLKNWGIPKKSRVFLSNIFPFKWWSFTNNPTRTKEFKTMVLHENHYLIPHQLPATWCFDHLGCQYHDYIPHSWGGLERVAISWLEAMGLSYLCCHLILLHHHHHRHQNEVAFIFHSQKKTYSPLRFSQHFSIFSPNFQKSLQITSQPSIHTPPFLLTPCWSPWRNPASVQVRRTWWMNDPRHDASTWSRPDSWITAIPGGAGSSSPGWWWYSLHVFLGCELTQVGWNDSTYTSETHVVIRPINREVV